MVYGGRQEPIPCATLLDLILLRSSQCCSVTSTPSTSFGDTQVTASPGCVPAVHPVFWIWEVLETPQAFGSHWSACRTWWPCRNVSPGQLLITSPEVPCPTLFFPIMENHAYARVGGQPDLRLFHFSSSPLCAGNGYLCILIGPFLTQGQTPSLPAFMFSD